MRSYFLLLFVAINLNAAEITVQGFVDCVVARENKLSREDVLFSEANLSDSRAGYLPTLSINGNALTRAQPDADKNLKQTTLVLNQKIVNLELHSEINANHSALEAAEQGLKAKILNSAVQMITQIGILEKNYEEKKILLREMSNYTKVIDHLSASSRIGISDSNDVLQAKAKYVGYEADIKQLNYEIQKLQTDFKIVFGFEAPPLTDVQFTNQEKIDVTNMPQILALRAQLEEFKFRKNAIDNQIIPTVALQATYTPGIQSSNSATGSNYEYNLGFVLDLSSLWNAHEKKVAYSSLIEQRKNIMRQQSRESQNYFDSLEKEINLLEEQQSLVQEKFEILNQSQKISNAKMKLGKMSFLDFQQSEGAQSATQLQLAEINIRKRLLLFEKNLTVDVVNRRINRSAECLLNSFNE